LVMEPVIIIGLLILGVGASFLGSLFGIGGGIIYIPFLTIVFGLSPSEAAAISLIGILATSAGAGAYYAEHGISNIRLGLYLEIGTTIGAIAGAIISAYVEDWFLSVFFIVFMLFNAARMAFGHGKDCGDEGPDHEFTVYDPKSGKTLGYDLKRKGIGSATCVVAGLYSSMTGVGGGVIKVPVMNSIMGVPMKAATSTSSYMIGITAFSGSIIYLINGTILLDYAVLVAIGSFLGMLVGTRVSAHLDTSSIKKYFSIVLVASATSVLLKLMGVL